MPSAKCAVLCLDPCPLPLPPAPALLQFGAERAESALKIVDDLIEQHRELPELLPRGRRSRLSQGGHHIQLLAHILERIGDLIDKIVPRRLEFGRVLLYFLLGWRRVAG